MDESDYLSNVRTRSISPLSLTNTTNADQRPIQVRQTRARSLSEPNTYRRPDQNDDGDTRSSTHRSGNMLRAPPPTRQHSNTLLSFGNVVRRTTPPLNRAMIEQITMFLSSATFSLICTQAMHLATLLPSTPPPAFSAMDMAMHTWYTALLVEFCETFTIALRKAGLYPMRSEGTEDGEEDRVAFTAELNRHCGAILDSFRRGLPVRIPGCTVGVAIDVLAPNAGVAAMALADVTQMAMYPPRKYWRVGQPLHAEYRRRLRMWEAGMARLLMNRARCGGVLEGLVLRYPDLLVWKTAQYKEFYVAWLRRELLRARGIGPWVQGGFVGRSAG